MVFFNKTVIEYIFFRTQKNMIEKIDFFHTIIFIKKVVKNHLFLSICDACLVI
mgnify:CR=1 FL=1